jgi:hypothetical protein
LLPEFNPRSPDNLASELPYHPLPEQPVSVHLPRRINLMDGKGRDLVCDFARRFSRESTGMVVHDHADTASRFDDYVAAVRNMNAKLEELGPGPMLFIEYAAGIPPEAYVALFESVRNCSRISACIDISHIGIRHCQVAYGKLYPGEDVCQLKWNSSALPARINDVQSVCAGALPVVCRTIQAIGRLGKPMHFRSASPQAGSSLPGDFVRAGPSWMLKSSECLGHALSTPRTACLPCCPHSADTA